MLGCHHKRIDAHQKQELHGKKARPLIEEEDKFFCLLDAPSKDAVIKHHEKHGFKCDWVTEVKTTAT
jgi:hypothetical protein